MKKLYKFNAEKYVKRGFELEAPVDMKWAVENDGKVVQINDQVGYGAMNGGLVSTAMCDEYKNPDVAELFSREPETELELAFGAIHKKALRRMAEMHADLDRLCDVTEELDEVNSGLMLAHENLLELIEEHGDKLPKPFISDVMENVVAVVVDTIYNIQEEEKECDCDSDCENCTCF